MKKSDIYIASIVILIFLLGCIYIFANFKENKETVPENLNENTSTESSDKTYTKEEVVAHNSKASCFTIVNENVYDVTAWISKHPGGNEAILSMCGIDGTESFTGTHGGQPQPEKVLTSFFIGKISK